MYLNYVYFDIVYINNVYMDNKKTMIISQATKEGAEGAAKDVAKEAAIEAAEDRLLKKFQIVS